MATQTLNITFAGVCVSLHGIVPGVPTRTVLPWATQVHFGFVWMPEDEGDCKLKRALYYIMPHIPWLRFSLTSVAGDITARGMPLLGQYLSIVNAIGPYTTDFNNHFSLPEYVDDFGLDEHVVYGGNAACYFDTIHGHVFTEGSGNEARVTRVQMQTDGPPILRYTPLPGAPPNAKTGEVQVNTNELFISNLDFDPATEYQNFDFLMNYLVAKGGIPQVLKKRVPGMTPQSKGVGLMRLGTRLKALGEAAATLGTVSGYINSGGRFADEKPGETKALPSPSPQEDDETFPWLMIDPVPFDTSCSPGNVP